MHILRRTLWSDEVFEINVSNVDNCAIKDYYITKRKESPGVKRSNRGGWQCDVPFGECQPIDDLIYRLEVCTQHIFYNVFKFDFEVRLAHCWLNCNSKNESNAMHTHPHSIFSGVYYIDVEDSYEQGAVRFIRRDSTPEFILDFSKDNPVDPLFSSEARLIPKKSYAYLFAPWTLHEVEPNQLDKERLVLAFNFLRANDMKNNIHQNSFYR